MSEIFATFSLRHLPNCQGQFYGYGWEEFSFLSRPPPPIKKWKDRWFFVSGDWEFQPGETDKSCKVPRHFMIPTWPHKRPDLSDKASERLEKVVELPPEFRDPDVLVTGNNLHLYGFDLNKLPMEERLKSMGLKSMKPPVVDLRNLTERVSKARKTSSTESAPQSSAKPVPAASSATSPSEDSSPLTSQPRTRSSSRKPPIQRSAKKTSPATPPVIPPIVPSVTPSATPTSKSAPSPSPSTRIPSEMADSISKIDAGQVPPELKSFMKRVAIVADNESRAYREELPLVDLASQCLNDSLMAALSEHTFRSRAIELENTCKARYLELENARKIQADLESELAHVKKSLKENQLSLENSQHSLKNSQISLKNAQLSLKNNQLSLDKANSQVEKLQSINQQLEAEIKETSLSASSLQSLLDAEKAKSSEAAQSNAETVQQEVERYLAELGLEKQFSEGYFAGFTSCQKWLIHQKVSLPADFYDAFDEDLIKDVVIPSAEPQSGPSETQPPAETTSEPTLPSSASFPPGSDEFHIQDSIELLPPSPKKTTKP